MIAARISTQLPAMGNGGWWQRLCRRWSSSEKRSSERTTSERTTSEKTATEKISSAIKRSPNSTRGNGKVFLVGAGPGDPELLTLKAARILAAADVVLYDRLVSTAILALVPDCAHAHYVGKCSGDHHVAQAETEQLLVRYARQGLQVVRLKGGDPFLFGRGGEEMQTLWRAGIEVEVVPGITAALGCAAYAGIPLTHREYASSVLFLTGCNQHGDLPASSEALARRDQTLVIYMGLARMPQLCASLQQCGLPADWPVALIAQGTTSSQQVLTGTLVTINEELAAMPLVSPTLVVVGRVVEVLLQQPARGVAASVDS